VVRADLLRGAGSPRGNLSRRPGRRFDVVTFDCYGTLIDWEAGIGDWLEAAASRAGVALDRRRALDLYAQTEPAVEAETYRSYRDVLAESARRVAQGLGWSLSEQDSRGLAASLPDWKPFPDTNPALRKLTAAGYRLGILSNVDDDLLAGTRRHLGVAFDILVTAGQVRPTSPRPATSKRRAGRSGRSGGSTPRRAASTTWSRAARSASPWRGSTAARSPRAPRSCRTSRCGPWPIWRTVSRGNAPAG
jgi:2-haloalkanoic acid dehalogenase type II